MVIVRFPNGTDWFKANWVFRQIVEDVTASFPNDRELKFVLEKAEACGELSFDSMREDVASRTLKAIDKVLEETTQGKVSGWKRTKPDDPDGQRMYLEAVSELLGLVKKQMMSTRSHAGN